ncbi:STAS domain-containing protein [Deltaproteobacteria bacterium TL4]
MIKIKIKNSLCIVQLLQNFTADDVHEVIEVIEGKQINRLLLDMGMLEMLTSSAIGLLIGLFNNLVEIKIKMGVTGLNDNNLHLFSLSKLDVLFSIYETVQHGIDDLKT